MTDWQDWNGGAWPHEDIAVMVRFRDGETSRARRASTLRWEHADLPDDVVAFRTFDDAALRAAH